MPSIDYLVTKLNVHGVNPGQLIGGSGLPELVTTDVFGALGMGHLSTNAYILGLAVHTLEPAMVRESVRLGIDLVDREFRIEGWSATKPFTQRINNMVAKGFIDPYAAGPEKLRLGEQLKHSMAILAIDELLDSNACKKCGGTGYVEGKLHATCHGTGRRGHSELHRADYCGIDYDAWLKTWRQRYQVIRTRFVDELNEFEIHVQRKAGR